MFRKLLIGFLVSFVLLAVWGTLAVLGSPADESAPADAVIETAAEAETSAISAVAPAAAGEISRTVDSPAISYIDSPSPTCYRPVAGTGICYISWNYMYVTASSGQYMISMTVSIDNNLRAYTSGFFQNYMYIPGDMTAPGFKVACGIAGAGGYANLGNSYSYTIRARETGGLGAANYGSVYCPADTVPVYLPLTCRP